MKSRHAPRNVMWFLIAGFGPRGIGARVSRGGVGRACPRCKSLMVVMRCAPVLVAALAALFGVSPCLAGDKATSDGVSMEELAVLKAVVSKMCDASCEIRGNTLSGHRLDRETFLMSGEEVPPESLIADYNARNAAGRVIPDGAFSGAARKPHFLPGPPGKSCQLSRPGFDKDGKRAMVVVKLVQVLPRDIISEGKCVLLLLKDGAWVADSTVQAWPARLGR